MTNDMRQRAFELYRGPFRYECGYIWDADGEMVADDRTGEGALERVRGWGRIQYLVKSEDEGAELQNAVGELIAEAMTTLWAERHRKSPPQATPDKDKETDR